MFSEDDYLQLSGIQHFAFCRRQWALIHVENQWAENRRTTEGALLHERAHDPRAREKRGGMIVARGVRVFSPSLGVSGSCDVLEFHRDEKGVPVRGLDGLYLPFPVEYKRGSPRGDDADALQLCAQAMCLEEMLCCEIPQGALFHKETQHRELVELTPELRSQVREMLSEMHELYARGHTPKAKPTKACGACSLKELCLPRLQRIRSVNAYLLSSLEETP